jgi:hypothetical protein
MTIGESIPIDLDEAIKVVKNPDELTSKREDMIWSLEEDGSERSIQTLVSLLTDDAFGVRWVAGTALTHLGDKAIPYVLKEIMQHFNLQLRDSVYHVMHYNHGLWTQWHMRPLLEALRGIVPDVTAPKEAYEMLMAYQHCREVPEEKIPSEMVKTER